MHSNAMSTVSLVKLLITTSFIASLVSATKKEQETSDFNQLHQETQASVDTNENEMKNLKDILANFGGIGDGRSMMEDMVEVEIDVEGVVAAYNDDTDGMDVRRIAASGLGSARSHRTARDRSGSQRTRTSGGVGLPVPLVLPTYSDDDFLKAPSDFAPLDFIASQMVNDGTFSGQGKLAWWAQRRMRISKCESTGEAMLQWGPMKKPTKGSLYNRKYRFTKGTFFVEQNVVKNYKVGNIRIMYAKGGNVAKDEKVVRDIYFKDIAAPATTKIVSAKLAEANIREVKYHYPSP